MANTGTRVFLVVGFDGLPEVLSQYCPEESSAFIYQNNDANRYFIEEVLREHRCLPVYGFPTNAELFMRDFRSNASRSMAYQDLDRECWMGLARIPDFVEQVRGFFKSLGPIREIVWYNRLDLWVALALSVAKQMGIPLRRVESPRDSIYRQHNWQAAELNRINPKLAGFIRHLGAVFPIQFELMDVYLSGVDRPVFSGIGLQNEDLPCTKVALKQVVDRQRTLKRHLSARTSNSYENIGGILYVDDGIGNSPEFGYHWGKTASRLRGYFRELPADLPVTIKMRRVPPHEDMQVKDELSRLFPSSKNIRFAPSLIPAEMLVEQYQTAYFVLGSCMVWPFACQRVNLFPLVQTIQNSPHDCFQRWVAHWLSLDDGGLETADPNPAVWIEDSTICAGHIS